MRYLTRTQLIKRWSKTLVDLYFPIPSDIRVNPKNKKYALMQLYDVNRIFEIEHLEVFKEELRKLLERRRKRLINKQLNG